MSEMLNVAAALGWPFTPGQRVRVKPGDGWRADWLGVEVQVVGICVDRFGKIRVHVSEDWPRDGGCDDMDADDLEAL